MTPDSILVHEDSGAVKIILSKSTIEKVGDAVTSNNNFNNFMIQATETYRYSSPEVLDLGSRTLASCSWAIGVML